MDELVWRVVEPAYNAVSIYDGPDILARDLAGLTAGQRALLAMHWTVAEVCNGGFDQYFVNSAGILARETQAGFHRIGATGAAALMAEVFEAFPGGAPPQDREERVNRLDTMEEDERDELFDAFDERFYALLSTELYPQAAAYIHAHPDEFVTSDPQ
jgi:hypothetical protein